MDEYPEDWEHVMYYEDGEETYETAFLQSHDLCVKPTLHEVFPHIWKLLLVNFAFRLLTYFYPYTPRYMYHVISVVCGVVALHLILTLSLQYIITFIVYCYISMTVAKLLSQEYWCYTLSVSIFLYLILSELYFPQPQIWMETRGLHMVIAMKVISLAFDVKRRVLQNFPTPIEYAGYTLCPCNSIFGPWISFNTYNSIFDNTIPLMHLGWVKRVVISIFLAVFFLLVSNCWAFLLLPQSWRWFSAYQEAFSFRSGHYFISFLSVAVMVTAGYGYEPPTKKKDSYWDFTITKPLLIEFPRSLVQVVVYWNVTMHMWLKNYVFKACKSMGSFSAIIATYLISSLLHGFNLKLAAVLLSLGFYTFVEYKLRNKLSDIFNACVRANPCKKCSHRHKRKSSVWIINGIFSALAVMHLAYLGCLLESASNFNETETHPFLKWQNLDFFSHVVVVITFIFYKVI